MFSKKGPHVFVHSAVRLTVSSICMVRNVNVVSGVEAVAWECVARVSQFFNITRAKTPSSTMLSQHSAEFARTQRLGDEARLTMLIMATINNHPRVVADLLAYPRVDPAAGANAAIFWAAYYGRDHIMQQLLDDGRADPTSDDHQPIKLTVKRGHVSTLRILLKDPRVTPNASLAATLHFSFPSLRCDLYLLHLATTNNHPDVVQVLLQDGRVDPTAHNCCVLREALSHGSHRIVDLLMADFRVRTALYDDEDLYEELQGGHTRRVETLRCMAVAKKSKADLPPTVGIHPLKRQAVLLARLLCDRRLHNKAHDITRNVIGFL